MQVTCKDRVQLPDLFRANQKSMHIIKDIIQMPVVLHCPFPGADPDIYPCQNFILLMITYCFIVSRSLQVLSSLLGLGSTSQCSIIGKLAKETLVLYLDNL